MSDIYKSGNNTFTESLKVTIFLASPSFYLYIVYIFILTSLRVNEQTNKRNKKRVNEQSSLYIFIYLYLVIEMVWPSGTSIVAVPAEQHENTQTLTQWSFGLNHSEHEGFQVSLHATCFSFLHVKKITTTMRYCLEE